MGEPFRVTKVPGLKSLTVVRGSLRHRRLELPPRQVKLNSLWDYVEDLQLKCFLYPALFFSLAGGLYEIFRIEFRLVLKD